MFTNVLAMALLATAQSTPAPPPRPSLRADQVDGATGGAKIAAVYRSSACEDGCIIDATRLIAGSDLNLDGFGTLDNIYINKPVTILLGAAEYRLSGSIILRADPAGGNRPGGSACLGTPAGATCIVDGMGIVGKGITQTRIRFANALKHKGERRYVVIFGSYAPQSGPDLYLPGSGRGIATQPVTRGATSFRVADPAHLAGVAPGSWILVANMHPHPLNHVSDFQHYEWKQVRSINGASVGVTTPFADTYNNVAAACGAETIACDPAFWFTMTGIARGTRLENFAIEDDTPGNAPARNPATGVYVSGAMSPVIRNVAVAMSRPQTSRSFVMRMYRTLRPVVDRFEADGAAGGLEIAHTLEGRFTNMDLRCGRRAGADLNWVTIDFGSRYNEFSNNRLRCNGGFMVIEADDNRIVDNVISGTRPNGSKAGLARSSGLVVYGSRNTEFSRNIVEDAGVGLYAADVAVPFDRKRRASAQWSPATFLPAKSCVVPPRSPWLVFCTSRAGVTGGRLPPFDAHAPGGRNAFKPLRDGADLVWHFAGALRRHSATVARENRFIRVDKPDLIPLAR